MNAPAKPACGLGGDCDLIDRSELCQRAVPNGWERQVGVVQCVRCSTVYEPVRRRLLMLLRALCFWRSVVPWQRRRCDACGLLYGVSLHDPCLGVIEGAAEACCGHGDPDAAYVTMR